MKLTNDTYLILIGGKTWTERYYRDESGWVKRSARGRKFRATAEQVLNHLLPALAGIKRNLTVTVEHHAPRARKVEKQQARATGSGHRTQKPGRRPALRDKSKEARSGVTRPTH
jgi:hypothetical protein